MVNDVVHNSTKENTKNHINAGMLFNKHRGQDDGHAQDA